LRRLAASLVLAALALCAPGRAEAFDYYVLALSWSPTYCATPEAEDDHAQCAPGRRFAFVVHGLWPQYERGWPDNCPTRERWVADRQIEEMLPIMPSKRLIIHQWRKHGTCSGLSQRDYFAMTRSLFGRVKIPARYISPAGDVVVTPGELMQDFLRSNDWLEPSMMALDCGNRRDRGRLEEIRICFSRSGDAIACGANEHRQCRAASLTLPPVR